jgi:hypothetical protein
MDPFLEIKPTWEVFSGGFAVARFNADGSLDTAYNTLHPYVHRPGVEADMALLNPMEYHASTSVLIQMLEKGHQQRWPKQLPDSGTVLARPQKEPGGMLTEKWGDRKMACPEGQGSRLWIFLQTQLLRNFIFLSPHFSVSSSDLSARNREVILDRIAPARRHLPPCPVRGKRSSGRPLMLCRRTGPTHAGF